MAKTTLRDIQDALDEAFGAGAYSIVKGGRPSLTYAEAQLITVPFTVAKKYLHCGGCNECQGEAPDDGA